MKPSIASLIAIAISGVCLVAADDESIINANEYLTGQAQNADNDVKKINVANAFEETQTALNDLNVVINAIGYAERTAEEAGESTDDGEENSIEDTFAQFTSALIGLAHDILDKKTEFQLNIDDSKVYDSIQSIRNELMSYDKVLVQKVKNKDVQDAISEATTTAFTELGKTQVEFAD